MRSDAAADDEIDGEYVGEPLEGHDVSFALFGTPEFATDQKMVTKFTAWMRKEKQTRLEIIQEAMDVLLERLGEEE